MKKAKEPTFNRFLKKCSNASTFKLGFIYKGITRGFGAHNIFPYSNFMMFVRNAHHNEFVSLGKLNLFTNILHYSDVFDEIMKIRLGTTISPYYDCQILKNVQVFKKGPMAAFDEFMKEYLVFYFNDKSNRTRHSILFYCFLFGILFATMTSIGVFYLAYRFLGYEVTIFFTLFFLIVLLVLKNIKQKI